MSTSRGPCADLQLGLYKSTNSETLTQPRFYKRAESNLQADEKPRQFIYSRCKTNLIRRVGQPLGVIIPHEWGRVSVLGKVCPLTYSCYKELNKTDLIRRVGQPLGEIIPHEWGRVSVLGKICPIFHQSFSHCSAQYTFTISTYSFSFSGQLSFGQDLVCFVLGSKNNV